MTKSEIINVRFTPKEREQIEEASTELGLSMSEYLRVGALVMLNRDDRTDAVQKGQSTAEAMDILEELRKLTWSFENYIGAREDEDEHGV